MASLSVDYLLTFTLAGILVVKYVAFDQDAEQSTPADVSSSSYSLPVTDCNDKTNGIAYIDSSEVTQKEDISPVSNEPEKEETGQNSQLGKNK